MSLTTFMTRADVAVVPVAHPLYRSPRYSGYADQRTRRSNDRSCLPLAMRSRANASAPPVARRSAHPATRILRAANAFAAALIVIGACSRGTIERFVLSSVRTKVMYGAGDVAS